MSSLVPLFEIRKNLDLRKILSTPKILIKSRFHCTTKNTKKYLKTNSADLPKFGIIKKKKFHWASVVREF